MPESPARIYWDANVFLSYINGSPAERLPVLDALLDSASAGEIEIVTSAISIAEVAFARIEQTKRALDPDVEAAIDSLWSDRRTVKLADVHELIAREARTVMRSAVARGWSLKPLDAIHLASARRLGVAQFHTYDRQLVRRMTDNSLGTATS